MRGILCAEIARFGDASDEGRIIAQLATEQCYSLLRRLETPPTLSAAVRAAIERVADAQLRRDPPCVDTSVLAVLWAHRPH